MIGEQYFFFNFFNYVNMRVVVSLTTLPDRYDNLYKTLKTVNNQTQKPDAIYLTLPYIAKRLNQPYPPLPKKIKKLCTIVRTKEDYGPICKIYGALVSEQDPDTIIITVDDDSIYPLNLIESLTNCSKLRPDAAITCMGILVGSGVSLFAINTTLQECKPYKNMLGFNVPNDGRAVDVVQGVSGVLYKRGFFPTCDNLYKELLHYTEDIDLFKSDDIVLSGYLSKKGIKRYTYPNMPFVDHHVTADGLSANINNMVGTFHRSIYKCRDLGMFQTFERCDIFDSCVFKVPFVIALFIIFVAFIIIVSLYI